MILTRTIRHGTQDRPIQEEKDLDDSINGSNFGILNWDSPTRVPPNAEPSSPDVSLASPHAHALSTLSSDHLPILIRLQMKTTSTPGLRRTYVNLKIQTRSGDRQQTAKKMRRSSVQFYSKQRHTTSRYWTTQTPRGTCTSRDIGCDDKTR